MNSEAKTVLWLGLIMIVAIILKDWTQIHDVLFKSSSDEGSLGKPGKNSPNNVIPGTKNPWWVPGTAGGPIL